MASSSSISESSHTKVDDLYPDWAKTPEPREVRVTRIAFGVMVLLGVGSIVALLLTHHISFSFFPPSISGDALAPFLVILATTILSSVYFGILAHREHKKLSYAKEKKEEIEARRKAENDNTPTQVKETDPYKTPESKEDWDKIISEAKVSESMDLVGEEQEETATCPLIGQYGDNYLTSHPEVVIKLPPNHGAQFPEDVKDIIKEKEINLCVSLAIHSSDPGFKPGQLNLLYHDVLMPEGQTGDANIEMGIFTWDEDKKGVGVSEARRRAIRFNNLAPEEVCIHKEENDFLYSPNNARFNYDASLPVVAFSSMAIINRKAHVTFNVMINTSTDVGKEMLRQLKEVIEEKKSLSDLLKIFETSDDVITSRLRQVLVM